MIEKIKHLTFFIILSFLCYKLFNVYSILLKNENIYRYRENLQYIYEKSFSANLVTGIYLDFRLYDSIFEATILFVAATGIIFMARKDIEMIDKLGIGRSRLFKKE